MAGLTPVSGFASAFSISVTISCLMVIIYCHQDTGKCILWVMGLKSSRKD